MMTIDFPLQKKKWIWICLGIALFLWAYQPLLHNDFVGYDDANYVVENSQIQKGFSWSNVVWAFSTTYFANWHPLTWISYAIDAQLYGLNPLGYHLVNLLFHGFNIYLLFFVLTKMTGQTGPSAMVAALFGLHPLNVESVAWVAERKNVLSMFFALLTIWAYLSYVKKKSWKNYFSALGFFLLGLMAKPMIVTLPVILLLLDFWPLKRFWCAGKAETPFDKKLSLQSESKIDRRKKGKKAALHSTHSAPSETSGMDLRLEENRRQDQSAQSLSARQFVDSFFSSVKEKIPFFALAALSSLVTLYAQKTGGAVKSLAVFPFPVRLANAVVAYVKYLSKTIWPERLVVFYPYPAAGVPLWQVFASLFILGVITCLSIRFARKWPCLLVGWLWYLVTLLPMIGIVQAGDQAMADRYAYLPLIGIFIAIVYFGFEWSGSRTSISTGLMGVALLVLIVLSCLTRYQVGLWKDDRTLFAHALRYTENNFVALNAIGKCLADEGKSLAAWEHFQKAYELNPTYRSAIENLAGAENNQGAIWGQKANYEKAALHFQRATQLRPDFAEFHMNLGLALRVMGRMPEALEQFQRVVQLQPGNVQAFNEAGALLQNLNRNEEALWYFQRVAQLKPDAQAYCQIGILLRKSGMTADAVLAFQQALKLNPQFEMAQSALRQIQKESQ